MLKKWGFFLFFVNVHKACAHNPKNLQIQIWIYHFGFFQEYFEFKFGVFRDSRHTCLVKNHKINPEFLGTYKLDFRGMVQCNTTW